MKEKGIILIPIWFILFASCSHKINPDRPSLAATNFKLDSLPNSEINIPIQINLKPLYIMADGCGNWFSLTQPIEVPVNG